MTVRLVDRFRDVPFGTALLWKCGRRWFVQDLRLLVLSFVLTACLAVLINSAASPTKDDLALVVGTPLLAFYMLSRFAHFFLSPPSPETSRHTLSSRDAQTLRAIAVPMALVLTLIPTILASSVVYYLFGVGWAWRGALTLAALLALAILSMMIVTVVCLRVRDGIMWLNAMFAVRLALIERVVDENTFLRGLIRPYGIRTLFGRFTASRHYGHF